MDTTKDSRTTPIKKNTCGGSPLGRQQKENGYLKQEFISYLQRKNLAQSSITHYTDYINKFFSYCEKEAIQVEKKDILKYLHYLQNKKNHENITRKNRLIALNHYFTFLLKNGKVANNPTTLIKIRGTHKRHLYRIYTPEELEQLYDNYYHHFLRNYDTLCYAPSRGGIPANQREQTLLSRQRNYAMLGLLVYQGLHTNELQKIQLNDVDLNKAQIHIKGGQKSNERTLSLNASQIGFLIRYIENIRPKLLTYQENQSDGQYLFLPLPEASKEKTDSRKLMHTFKPLTKHIKTLDKHFLNFKQVRASVITHWLKTYGLRKAQYMAGHRYISSTENYLPNEIESLSDDITKYSPF